MGDLSLEKLLLFCLFVAPGLVAMRVFGLLVPTERRDATSTLLNAVTYGLINIGLTFWIIEYAVTDGRALWLRVLLFAVVVLVTPTLLAVATFLLRTWRILGRWFDHPSPSGWDHFFLQRRPCWVLFHFKDGTKAAGKYDTNSRASLYPFPRELYLEEVWRVDEHGAFKEKVPDTAGMIVKFDDCNVVEFFNLESEEWQNESPEQTA